MKLADLDSGGKPKSKKESEKPKEQPEEQAKPKHGESTSGSSPVFTGLRYNVEIHLPATKDVEVYNAIFKSLKEHLLED